MIALTNHITSRLATRPYCTVFESDLSRVFPKVANADDQRDRAIHEFAKKNGWVAKISDPGIRVTFQKLKEGGTDRKK